MDPNEYATTALTLFTLALLGIGTLAMIVRWILRVRREHPTITQDFVADVKRGEGFTFHRQLRRKPQNRGHNGGPHKLNGNGAGATQVPQLIALAQAIRIINEYPDEAPHTLIVGSTRKGKTTLAHAIIELRGDKIAILDPKWQPNKWGGAPAVPIDDDGGYSQLEAAIKYLLAELNNRLVSLKRGGAEFTPLTIIADELQTLVDECESAPQLFKQIGRLGGELKVRLVAIATSDQVKSLGIEGEGDTRDNYTIIRLAEHAYRKAPTVKELNLSRPAIIEFHGNLYAADLSNTIELAQRRIPVTRYYELPLGDTGTDNLLSNLLTKQRRGDLPKRPRFDPVDLWEKGQDQAESLPAPETNFQAPESDTAFSLPDFSAEEIAQIAALITRGKGKTEVLQSMRGYSGRKHKVYSPFYERLKSAVEQMAREEEVSKS